MSEPTDTEDLIEEQLHILHEENKKFEKLMTQFHRQAVSQKAYKSMIKKGLDLKKKTPHKYQEMKTKMDDSLASLIANQRHNAMKPMNRKAVHKRRWV